MANRTAEKIVDKLLEYGMDGSIPPGHRDDPMRVGKSPLDLTHSDFSGKRPHGGDLEDGGENEEGHEPKELPRKIPPGHKARFNWKPHNPDSGINPPL